MAAWSDRLLVVTVLCYLAAMVVHAAQQAGHDGVEPVRRGRRRQATMVAAAVRGAAPRQGGDDDPPVTAGMTSTVPRRLMPVLDRAAVVATVVGASAHLGTLITRGVAAGRMPWGNMYEFILSVTFVGAATWVSVGLRRPAIRSVGLFVMLALVMLLGAAGLIAYTPVGPLVPALKSYWFVIHVTAAIVSSGILLLGFVPAVLYLIRTGYDRAHSRFPYTLGRRLPAAEVLERLTFRLHAFAFPIWTFAALIAGPLWAEAAWGRYWGWDPKEVWAFVSWVVYASYLHARATPSITRSTVTWIAIVGWATMIVNLFGVNLFFGGLHSYAGVK